MIRGARFFRSLAWFVLLAAGTIGVISCAGQELPKPARIEAASPEELAALEAGLSARLTAERRPAEVLGALALVLQRLQRLDEAENAALEASQIEPFRADFLYALGAIQLESGKRFRALLSFTQAIRLDPQFLEAYVQAAHVQRLLGEPERARTTLEQAISIEPKHYESRLELADLLLERGDPAGAQSHVEVARKVQPASPEAAQLHVAILKAQGQLGAAQAVIETWLQSAPESAEWWRELLELHRMRGYWGQVEAVLGRIEALGPLDSADQVVKAELAEARGDRAGAAALRAQLLRERPRDPLVLVAAAKGLLAENRPLESLAPLESAAQAKPDWFEVHYWRAVALYRLGRPVEGDLALNRAEALAGTHPPVRRLRIRRLISERRLSEAAPLLQSYLQAYPGDLDGILLQAELHNLSGDFLAAERRLRGLPLDVAGVRFARAQLAFLQQKFLTVLDEMAPLTGLAKPPWEAIYVEAAALGRLGRGNEALEKIRPWLDRDEGAPAFHRLAASIQLQAGDLRAAERTIVQGMRRFPRDPVLIEGISRIAMDRDNWREARNWLEAGVEKDSPLLPLLLERLVLVYRRLGDGERVRQAQLRLQTLIDPLSREVLERGDPAVLFPMTLAPLELAIGAPGT
jgi:tetratricopeptide (TPR) repeat protein